MKGIRIRCVETGEEFESIQKAGLRYRISDMAIRKALNDAERTAGGYHWASVGEYRAGGIPIRCVEKKKEYGSISEAARKTGVSVEAIRNALQGVTQTGGGYHWKRLDGVPIPDGPMRKEGKAWSAVRVRIKETGEEFESIRAAAEETGFARDWISEALKYPWVVTGGYHWERID